LFLLNFFFSLIGKLFKLKKEEMMIKNKYFQRLNPIQEIR